VDVYRCAEGGAEEHGGGRLAYAAVVTPDARTSASGKTCRGSGSGSTAQPATEVDVGAFRFWLCELISLTPNLATSSRLLQGAMGISVEGGTTWQHLNNSSWSSHSSRHVGTNHPPSFTIKYVHLCEKSRDEWHSCC
jgi:hypothetical protein